MVSLPTTSGNPDQINFMKLRLRLSGFSEVITREWWAKAKLEEFQVSF